MALSDSAQQERREWFRDHWQNGVAFNRFCNLTVRRWDADGAELHLPFAEHLTAQDGIFHGGVVSALLDTTATGAVIAGHDFDRGSRLTTVSMTVQYLSVAPGEDLVATGQCVRRGRSVNFAQARAVGADSGKLVATVQVIANISGERPGAPWSTGTS